MKPNINNLFIYILKKKNKEVQNFLLENNNIDIKDEFKRTPLINATFYNNFELINWLLSKGAYIDSVDINGYTALHFAAQEANEESLSLLIENNANINIQDINGNTATWVCVMNWKAGKNFNNLKSLFKSNADFEIKNNFGKCAKEIIPEKIFSQLNNWSDSPNEEDPKPDKPRGGWSVFD
jgi:ankyrin repeat protein